MHVRCVLMNVRVHAQPGTLTRMVGWVDRIWVNLHLNAVSPLRQQREVAEDCLDNCVWSSAALRPAARGAGLAARPSCRRPARSHVRAARRPLSYYPCPSVCVKSGERWFVWSQKIFSWRTDFSFMWLVDFSKIFSTQTLPIGTYSYVIKIEDLLTYTVEGPLHRRCILSISVGLFSLLERQKRKYYVLM